MKLHISLASTLLLASCQFGAGTLEAPVSDHLDVDAPRAQRFEEIGPYRRPVTTSSDEAQRYFDQGLAWMYSFNHDEAIRSFAKAAELDPDCAMAWWGISICEGPNYNDPVMTDERSGAAWSALKEAEARAASASPVERGLIEALAARYAFPWPEDRAALNEAYAAAMEELLARFPDDPEVGTLYGESLMVLRPWQLYTIDRLPEADTAKITAALEAVLEKHPNNPGANHLYIHAVEPSLEPERALPAADRLRNQIPVSGHMNHMPSHIYVQTGDWDKSIVQNRAAMGRDTAYLERSPDQGIQHMYIVHNAHMLAYSAMMVGQETEAMEAARSMLPGVPEQMLPAVADFVDLWMSSVYDVQKRFGRWDAILAEPAPPETLPITTAIWRAHRAIAFAAKHEFEDAEAEYERFKEARDAFPEDKMSGSDATRRILEVSDHFIRGEIALQRGQWDRAIAALEQAVEVEDSLSYGEPPQWLQPTRHTLGAVLLKAGRPADAEAVYLEDLERWPGNGWSLLGLSRSLRAQGKLEAAAAAEARYEAAWKGADRPVTSSCLCLPDA
ncbi:MAG: tetratricopeptide repeat protein [Planctomycetes bacterium]|nr:tetratricopeptide repeat protein [Planctomycetota bacterium]